MARTLAVETSGVATATFRGSNGMPQCAFSARLRHGERVEVTVNGAPDGLCVDCRGYTAITAALPNASAARLWCPRPERPHPALATQPRVMPGPSAASMRVRLVGGDPARTLTW
jgi:hypothetical protein